MSEVVAAVAVIEGDPDSGRCVYQLAPRAEHLRWLLSERSMGNLKATAAFGDQAVSYNYLGLMSDAGALLWSVPVPLGEYARFTVAGDRLTIASPAPVKLERGDMVELLEAYGERHRAERLAPPIVGWNSWDAFNASVGFEDVVANADAIAADEYLSAKLTHVILDDGWMTNWGEWTANGKFAAGMDALAAAIRERGLSPGIWLAPLCAEPVTRLFQRHPECFLQDQQGHPYLISHGFTRTIYALDVSVERTRRFLRETFRRVAEWGYRYVKLDFLHSQAECLERGDATAAEPSWSTNRHIVEMLAIAREELGDETHILGCNYPLELGGQGVDEVRLTNDIASFWQNVDFCYRAHLARFHLSRRWFATDPDFAVVRVPGVTWTDGAVPFHVTPAWNRHEAPGGWRRGRFWTEEEMKVGLALVILSGGSIILGDHLPQLNARGREYVQTAIEHGLGQPARPLDLDGRRPLPCVWRNDKLVGLFNLTAVPLRLEPPAETALAEEVFTGAPSPDGPIELAPHTVRLCRIA